MKKVKISVIIPIYNAQSYLPECLKSLSKQTFRDFETILVDDGSEDDSFKICMDFKNNMSNLEVLHIENSGVSIARNIGLNHATGDLIVFIDADDVLERDFLEKISYPMLEKSIDLVCCRYSTSPILNKSVSTRDNIILDSNNFGFQVLSNIEIGGFLWNKIFRKSIIDKMPMLFPEKISIWEDKFFILNYLNYCEKVECINDVLYYYRQHENSAISFMNYDKIRHKLFVDESLRKSVQFKKSKELLNYEYFRLLIDWGMIGKKSNQLIKKDKNQIVRSIIKEKGYKYLNIKRKINFIYILL